MPIGQRDDREYNKFVESSPNQPAVVVTGDPATGLPVVGFQGTPTSTNPTVTTANNFTLLAANASRKYLLIENNTSANIMINLSGGNLTDIVPSSTNKGIVLLPNGSYESPSGYVTTSLIKVYQTSGSNTNLISVVEG